MTDRRPPSPLAITLLFALLCLVWSSTWIVIEVGLHDLPTYTGAALRFSIAGVVMLLLGPTLHRREGGTAPPPWLWLTIGTLNFALSYGLLYHCEQQGLLPSLAAVLWAVFPLLMALSGRLFLGERLRLVQGLGFVVSVAGVAALFVTDLSSIHGGMVPLALLLLLSPLVSCLGTTLLKRHGAGCSSALLNRNAMLTGAVLLGVVALLHDAGQPIRWSCRAVLSLGYLSLFGTVLTFGIYHWLLRWASASLMSLIAVITPAVALLLDWLFGLLVQPTWTLFCGTATILVGVAMVVRGRR